MEDDDRSTGSVGTEMGGIEPVAGEPAGQPDAESEPRASGLATWSLVTAIGGVVVGLAVGVAIGQSGRTPDWAVVVGLVVLAGWVTAVVFGAMGFREVRRSEGSLRGRGRAIAGLSVSSVMLAMVVIGAIGTTRGDDAALVRDDFEGPVNGRRTRIPS